MVRPAWRACFSPWGRSVKLNGLARHQFAVFSLAAIALVSSLWFLLDVLGTASHSTKTFGVTAFENRFSDFRKTVQPHSVYGYVSDNPPGDPSARPEFYLTQYTLAPGIIRLSGNEKLVILNSHSNQPDPKILQANHLVPVQDFGNGVLLCRQGPR
jgi:hypothetical protein